jgi:hypothetical protein
MISSENRKSTFRDHACRKRVEKRRFVHETASTARSDCCVAQQFVVSKNSDAKNAPRERMVMTQQTAAEVDAEPAALRRHYCNTFSSGAHARYTVAGPADLTACDGLTKLSTAP